MQFDTWRQMLAVIASMDESQLVTAIILEASTYRRKNIITRLHQRYTRLRAHREREALIEGKSLL